MSYCRFSSDNWQSDVYAYGDVRGGYTVHVACNRPDVVLPPLPDVWAAPDDEPLWKEYWEIHAEQMRLLHTAPRVPIGKACDGETYSEPTLLLLLERLSGLRALGYLVPQYALDLVAYEIAEEEGERK